MLTKGLTLNETWDKCLEMWQWIAEVKLGNPSMEETETLKEIWLKEHFQGGHPGCGCFFCDYDNHNCNNCKSCPASLVDNNFDCSNDRYDYGDKPVAFYNKILELNEIRLARRK